MQKAPKYIGIGLLVLALGLVAALKFIPDFDLRVKNLYRKNVLGNQHPIEWVSAHPLKDSILITWENPGDKLFEEVELYFATDGTANRQSSRIQLSGGQSSYLWWTPPADAKYLSIAAYSRDKNQQFAEPVTEHIEFNNRRSDVPGGLFTYDYHHEGWHSRTLLPYYVLENEALRCYFAYGVPIGVENKQSDLRPEFQLYGPLNSFFKDMDIWEKVEGQTQDLPIFSTYLEAFGGDSIWFETQQDSLQIKFTAYHLVRGPLAQTSFSLDSNKLGIQLTPLNDSKYMARLNTTGDDNYKAVTHWTAESIPQVVPDEKRKDIADGLKANTYQHRDAVFNDTYPYLDSRVFLGMDAHSRFRLFNGSTELFRLQKIQGTTDFYYKNCTGEENFGFGAPGPYEQHSPALEGKLSLELEVVY